MGIELGNGGAVAIGPFMLATDLANRLCSVDQRLRKPDCFFQNVAISNGVDHARVERLPCAYRFT